VVVIGGGDSALEEAIFLTRYAASITIIHRRDEFRAGQILVKRAKDNPKIKFLFNTVVDEILGETGVENLKLRDVKTGKQSTLAADGVFIFIGHTPNTEMFKGQLAMDEKGYLIANQLMETSVPGVYAAGEVMDSHFRQVVTSAGMGAAAAIQAGRFLEENSLVETAAAQPDLEKA
jgi:thioredoxin reductase (NADPH)